ncbi:desmocollin-2-like [Alosa sapidissima]|uniref:desmocollin-2-like n=1 Tax=Alosa sapidissima TaxID=34773 RepID=UPI001C0A591C|nr:desmocollin-2-like [Alosa sapidissima]
MVYGGVLNMSTGPILYSILIYMVLIQCAQCCVPSTIQAQVPVEVKAGYVVSKVNVGDCGARRFYFSVCDPDFAVLPDGTIVTARVTRITSEGKSFCVWAQDQRHHRWKVDVTLTHTEQPHVPQQKTGVLRRFRRRWSPPPIYLQENAPPPYPKDLEQIGSDSSQNQTVYYTISGPGVTTHPKDVFSCDERSGLLRVHRPLDREEFPVVVFTARVFNVFTRKETDLPLPITVHIEDVNDNAPEFVGSLLYSVEEHSKIGTVVGQINATDNDEPNTSHTKIRYILLSSTDLFSIHSFTGIISIKSASLDRETQEKHLVTVEIRDMGGASNGLSNTATATISLTDINDNAPTFSETKYKARVEENKANILVLRIPVEDKDLKGTPNWKVVLKIVKGNEKGYFRVDTDPKTNEGLLYVIKPLDHEEGGHLMLEIVAENEAPLVGSGAWMQVPVELTVGDEDEGPVFSPPLLRLRVQENIPNGTLIGTYTAVDPETRNSNGITYYEDTDPASWISVDENTGGLKTTNTIDRESKFVSNGMYNITVRAVDTIKKQGIGTVLIVIDDVNDNNPKITTPDQILCEKEGELGSITLHAEDADARPYGEPFTFELGEEADGKWKLKDAKGTSVVLQQAVALPLGLYNVPVVVRDLQGIGEVQMVNVRVCECVTDTPGEEVCAAQKRSAVLGSWGVLAMLLALLLLLLLVLLFVFICSTKREKLYIDDGSGGMLLKSNIEAPGEEVKTDPFLLVCPSPVEAVDSQLKGQGVGLGGGIGGGMGGGLGGGMGGGLDQQHMYQENAFQTSNREFVTEGHTNIYTSGQYGQGFYGDAGFVNYSGALDMWRSNELYLDKKLVYFYEEADGRYADDLLKDYGYEGEGSSVGSLDCLSQMGIEEDSLDFLDTLGPKFRLLAHACTRTADDEEEE